MSELKRHYTKSELDLMAEALRVDPGFMGSLKSGRKKFVEAQSLLEQLVAFLYSFDRERSKRFPKIEAELKKRIPELTYSFTMGPGCLSLSEISHMQQELGKWIPSDHVRSCIGCRTFAWLEWTKTHEEAPK